MSQPNSEPWSAEVTLPGGSRATVWMRDGAISLGSGALPVGTVLPAGLLSLSLDCGTLPEGIELPAGLEKLRLGDGTLPPGTVLPATLKELDLEAGTLPPGTKLPDGLVELGLSCGTLPEGTVLPKGLKRLYLAGGKLPAGTELPKGLEVFAAGTGGIYGPSKSAPRPPAAEPASEGPGKSHFAELKELEMTDPPFAATIRGEKVEVLGPASDFDPNVLAGVLKPDTSPSRFRWWRIQHKNGRAENVSVYALRKNGIPLIPIPEGAGPVEIPIVDFVALQGRRPAKATFLAADPVTEAETGGVRP